MFGYYLNLALHSLRRNRVLTTLMVLAIAVGIGASMTTLTVAHLLSGDPLPGRSGTLFHVQVDPVTGSAPTDALPSSMDYRSAMDLWRADRAERQTLVATAPVKLRAADSGRPMLPRGMLLTTSEFFTMFNVHFAYGGPWLPGTGVNGGRVAVISARLNDRLFGGVDSVGRTLRLGHVDVRIVGVLKPWRPVPLYYELWDGHGAEGKHASSFFGRPEDVYVPLSTGIDIRAASHQIMPVHRCWRHDEGLAFIIQHIDAAPCLWVSMWVELSTPSSVRAYASFLAAYAGTQAAAGRFQNKRTRLMSLTQWLDWNQVVPADVRAQVWMALGFLAICLVNNIGLLLTKFLRRSGEIGVRRAMGATRRAVFAQCLMEAGVIGVCGGIGGWALTELGLWLIRRQPVAYAYLAHLDLRMFVVTFALALGASLLVGVVPALRACRVPVNLQLKTL